MTLGSVGLGGLTSTGLAKISNVLLRSPFTSAESFMGPDMENVIVLPLMVGVMFLFEGRILADVIFP